MKAVDLQKRVIFVQILLFICSFEQKVCKQEGRPLHAANHPPPPWKLTLSLALRGFRDKVGVVRDEVGVKPAMARKGPHLPSSSSSLGCIWLHIQDCHSSTAHEVSAFGVSDNKDCRFRG